jgi:anti-sigma factor RsiW
MGETGGAMGDRRLERLVDGELSPDEHRALLASLDDEPGGWRRCALAFLEAQALAAELGTLRRAAERREKAPAHVARKEKMDKPRTWLAVAASFLLAFTLGVLAPRWFSFVSHGLKQEQVAGGNNIGTSPRRTPQELHPTPVSIGNLHLVMAGPNGELSQSGNVPVYEVEQGVDEFLARGTPALSPELIEYLEQQGYEVRHEQQYFPAALDDGRELIVPVDGYQITRASPRY